MNDRPGTSVLTSVIIPVYNEGNTITEIIDRLYKAGFVKQIILIDDGSTDGTPERIQECISRRPEIVTIRGRSNQGKGSAIRAALPLVKGQLVAIQDADLEYDPTDLDKLIATACKNPNTIVYGSRYLDRNAVRHLSLFRLGVCFLNCLLLVLYRTRLTDVMTCYKVFPTEALVRMELECQRFEFCTEVTAKAVRLGIPIVEVPVSYVPRSKRDGKKLRFRDGWRNAWNLLRLQHWKPNLASNQPNAVDGNAGY